MNKLAIIIPAYKVNLTVKFDVKDTVFARFAR